MYYTDTDSVVKGNPRPEELISKYELGKLKFVCKMREGILNPAKSC